MSALSGVQNTQRDTMTRNKKSAFLGDPIPSVSRMIDVAPGRGGDLGSEGGRGAPNNGIDICTKPWEAKSNLP
jgi:hypothetical protein